MYVCMYECITKSITKGTKLKKNYRNIAEQTQKLSHATQQSHFDMSDILFDTCCNIFPSFETSISKRNAPSGYSFHSMPLTRKFLLATFFGKIRYFLSLKTKDLHLALL